uniref:Uncharacterized protein n=1 Tax=Anguilla anguilla TaxID=7936 RepID=A0A0E9WGG6_ANGAN
MMRIPAHIQDKMGEASLLWKRLMTDLSLFCNSRFTPVECVHHTIHNTQAKSLVFLVAFELLWSSS